MEPLPLIDRHGRVATDLRVSLTDRCNLRCDYCMPAEGLPWLPREELLSDAELVRLISIGVERLGITSIRFTGGEPLLRQGLVGLVEAAAALDPRPELALTTNGLGLDKLAPALAAAGLDRLNISMDSIRPETFAEITRRDRLSDVQQGIQAAADAGLGPIKVNAVLLRGVNEDQAVELLDWCLERDLRLRFIEQMPLDPQHGWSRSEMITAEEIHSLLSQRYRLTPMAGRGSSPAEDFLVDDGPGRVGIIASVSKPFCGDCNRVRLTADGQIRNCLFAREESDLRAALRGGATDAEIAQQWAAAVLGKFPGHGINDPSFLQPDRPMSAIGG